ncbi:unnamed protein product [Polarella glacialis]|uniref:Glycerophosphocholine acyltransferase 1 n=1 Tax=Polarella glacialis TaxID=89957 RepID=A0A813DNY0_POLGL|nr:unnamed protein product [Polarella glacialis]CAE8618580.1 unnamed protein product [Polarella glacialis]
MIQRSSCPTHHWWLSWIWLSSAAADLAAAEIAAAELAAAELAAAEEQNYKTASSPSLQRTSVLSPSCQVVFSLAVICLYDWILLRGLEQSQDMTVKVPGCVILFFGLLYLLTGVYKYSPASSEQAVLTAEEDDEKKIEAHNIYQDFTKPFVRVVIVFVAQTMLFLYFFKGLTDRVGPLDAKGKPNAYMFWISSIPIQFLLLDPRRYSPLSIPALEIAFWGYVLQNQHDARISTSEGSTTITAAYPSRPELWLRCIFSVCSNIIYSMIIFWCLPMQLMHVENGMDFVKNTFAIWYIGTLDDLPETSIMRIIAPEEWSSEEWSSEEWSSA